MLILLTNDDGIHAPGLRALQAELEKMGDVYVVAPSTEQSGVGHSITYLTPLIAKQIFGPERQHRGWAVDGRPADCVKLGITEFCPRRPDLVVSGMNEGLNAGINVLYSGTVAAAVEGAFFGINSIAVSLEYDEEARRPEAARLARQVIEQILAQQDEPQLYNLNIPTDAVMQARPAVRVVPLGLFHYGDRYERRVDPRGRNYYWAGSDPAPPPSPFESDITALREGSITVTPLGFDLTHRQTLTKMESWSFGLRGNSPPST